MDGYLTKPLHVAELAQMLARWLPQMQSTPEGSTPFPRRDAADDQGDSPVRAPRQALPAASETPPIPAEPPILDLDRLAQFKEFDDDRLTMTREVIGLFVADARQRLKAIEDSVAANDAMALVWAAHALIGATSNVGAVAMQTVCSELEADAKAGVVPANAEQQLQRLQGYWTRTNAMLVSSI